VREISTQTAEGTTATSTSIAKLAALAAQLRKSVSGFRLPDYGGGTTTLAAGSPGSTGSTGSTGILPAVKEPVNVSNPGKMRKASGAGA
jgi:hypothetical protein